ncbi:MAG TPA: S8 family peptidase, partial [Thermoanaerobaculia bacterium]
ELQALRENQQLREVTGLNLSFDLDLNPDLPLDSLENRQAGIELLAFRDLGDGKGVATVFVPEGKLKVFERKLRDYLDPVKSTEAGVRRGEKLINSIAGIRRAALRDLWTDPVRELPTEEEAFWWEVWIRGKPGSDRFRNHAEKLGIGVGQQVLRFPDRAIVLAWATVGQMTLSVDLLDSIAELRGAHSLTVELPRIGSREEREKVGDLRTRIEPPSQDAPAICVLDTGADLGHPLLEFALPRENAHSYEQSWGVEDRQGHGTEMEGFALYGDDLEGQLLTEEPVRLRHQIESVKILRRDGDNTPDLYGEITQAAAARVEIAAPRRPRVFSLSVTADKCQEGRPSSWSAALDQLCSGSEETERPARLAFVSSGNAAVGEGYVYQDSNQTDCLEDPAQAWNAVTIGAYTEKVTIHEDDYRGWEPVAPSGDMSPCNTTSMTWLREWPNKPDLVLEGGNWARDPQEGILDRPESLSLLTTKLRRGSRLIGYSGETSAATAQGARLGALVLVDYPELWPETIRALLVHSARWTPAMQSRFQDQTPRRRVENLLRCYGYGVPDLDRALYSLRHQLTLVIQESFQPFRLDGSTAKTKDMHLHRLPWPAEVLEQMGEAQVRLRVTLSYFIEPKPGQRRGPGAVGRRYRYASHGLRFAIKTASESEQEFLRKINKAERVEDEEIDAHRDTEEWLIGQARDRGAIHSDVWTGTATDLAAKELIAVFPVLGWWRDPRQRDRVERSVRYSLVVSIESDAAEVEIEGARVPVDFYTEVLNQIEIQGIQTVV